MSSANFSEKLKVGIVGLGKMGLLHASLLSVMPNIELTALCDKSWIMRKLAKNTLKVSLVTDKLDDLAGQNLDVVYVTTPIPSHYPIIREVYTKNIAPNVFVEKTLSSSYNHSKELCALSDASKGQNMVGYMKRFSVTFKKVKELLNEGKLGSLISFDAYAYSSDFAGLKENSATVARGGVLEDLGSHVSDLALWLFEDLLSSTKLLSSTDPSSGSVHFEIMGSNNFTGKFDVSWIKQGYRMPEFGFTIKGVEGTINVDDNMIELVLNDKQPRTLYRQDLDDHVAYLLGESEYFREDDHFINSILLNRKPQSDFLSATRVDYLLEQVRRKN